MAPVPLLLILAAAQAPLDIREGLPGESALAERPGRASELGRDLCTVGDVDGDGFEDYAVSAPGTSRAGETVGAVAVFSGRSDEQVRWFEGTAKEPLGAWLRAVPDLDGDGVGELWVSRNEQWGLLVGLATGASLELGGEPHDCFERKRWIGEKPAEFSLPGWHVEACPTVTGAGVGLQGVYLRLPVPIGDVDLDGVGDFLCPPDPGAELAQVRSGSRGRLLLQFDPGALPGVRTKEILSGCAGDVDGDGAPEVLVGLPGAVVALAVPSGRVVHVVEESGGRIVGLGDVDEDGAQEFALSSGINRVVAFSSRGILWADGTETWGEEYSALATLPDRDGDGAREILVGSIDPWEPGLRVLSGASGATLHVQLARDLVLERNRPQTTPEKK